MQDAPAERDEAPLLSVIIPAFNREASIGRAIQSVADGAAGSYEIIVVDDGSSDRTVAVAQQAIETSHNGSGQVICQPNAGPGAARNTGALAAHGRYLAFLDSDDFWLPPTLAACVDTLGHDTSASLVFLQTIDVAEGEDIDRGEHDTIEVSRFDGFLEAVLGFPATRYGSCNAIVRRDVYAALGGFTTEVRCSEDTDLFFRAAASGPCLVLSGQPLVAHVHGPGERLTGRFADVLRGYEFMLAQERDGLYPNHKGRAVFKDQVFAQCSAHTILGAFAAGEIGTAYRLYFESAARLRRAQNWHWLIRLPLVPLLAVLRPKSYQARWRPKLG